MKNSNAVIYETVVFNDQYGKDVRCRCDIDRQHGFIRHQNGVIEHRIPEKNQVRFGYVLASGEKREMRILADSIKAILDGLEMQTEARKVFNYVTKRYGSFDKFIKLNDLRVPNSISRDIDFNRTFEGE